MFERFKVDFPVRYFCKELNKEGKGKLIDISAGGGGLILTLDELSKSFHLEIWVELPDNRDPLYLTGTVIWSKQIESHLFRTGIQFDHFDFMSISRILRIIKSPH
ncbi:MAG: PilZ domain-containing protein [Candidatus Omnitrophica bacterium]|nr:PilZ domain-containing protein [Candidatus Omnitrophota bacterium]